MPGTPSFLYFLSNETHPVTEKSDIWNARMPLSRKQIDGVREKEPGMPIRYGDYFYSVRSFLEQNRLDILKRAVSQHLSRNISLDEIRQVQICLEKHGAFYHPARIVLEVKGKKISFVVNVALSSVGVALIYREYRILETLNRDFPHTFVPKVYGQGEIPISVGDRVLRMFLGEWFEGFNEFHVSRDQTDGRLKLMVWDPVQGNFFLSAEQAKELYRQVAMILTYYYNIETFEQISLWHHAAGDFVVKLRDSNVELKLVTVRQYASLFEEDDTEEKASAAEVLEAMLIFFLNLSIRMRLDRLEGVGRVVWSDNIAVESTLKGFFQGLALKAKDGFISDSLLEFFQNYLSRCTEADLFDLFQTIVNRYHPCAPEIPVIKENLKAHAGILFRTIYQI